MPAVPFPQPISVIAITDTLHKIFMELPALGVYRKRLFGDKLLMMLHIEIALFAIQSMHAHWVRCPVILVMQLIITTILLLMSYMAIGIMRLIPVRLIQVDQGRQLAPATPITSPTRQEQAVCLLTPALK